MADRPNPYVGPYAFQEQDAPFFFGRDEEADRLLALVISERVVLLCSPSGAGKTSLINARLVPELRRKGFAVLPVARVSGKLAPGTSPPNVYAYNALRTLAGETADLADLREMTLDSFLHPQASVPGDQAPQPRVLILDQFEEILTTYPERWQDRRGFFLQLRQALLDDPALSVVLSLREDHLAGLDPYASLLPGQLRTRFRLEPLHRRYAVDAIRRPAAAAGRPFAAEVAETLADNLAQIHLAGQTETALGELVEPVQLQVVCFQLWENLRGQPGPTITEDDRRKFGDVDQALERFYDSAVERAAQESGVEAAKIRRWFGTALITPTHIRSQVSREAETSGGLPNAAVDKLVALHLIRPEATRGGTWYELAHDRFIDPVLRSNAKAQPPEISRLASDARAWLEGRRDPSFLYRGQRLKNAAEMAEDGSRVLSKLERDFLAESEKAKAIEELRRVWRLRAVVSGLSVLLLAVAILAYFALQQWSIAQRESRLALSRELALSAVASAERDPDLGILLALEAGKRSSEPEVEAALHQVLSASAVQRIRSIQIAAGSARAFALSPDGKSFAAVDADGKLAIWETETGRRVQTFEGLTAPIGSAVFSPDGSKLAAGNIQAHVVVWSTLTAKALTDFHPGGVEVNALAFSPKGDLLAVATDDPEPTLWNAGSGEKVKTLTGGHSSVVWDIAFAPGGKMLATAGDDRKAILWDVDSGRPIRALMHPAPVLGVAFDPDGELATACRDGIARTWSPQTGIVNQPFVGHRDWVWGVTFSIDGKYLMTASADATAKIWDRASGEEVRTLSPGGGPLVRAAFSPRSGRLMTVGEAPLSDTGDRRGTATLWNLEDVQTLKGGNIPILGIAFSRDSRRLVTTDRSGWTILWDTTGLRLAAFRDEHFAGFPLSKPQLNPEGNRLATPGEDGAVRIWEIPSGRVLQVLRDHKSPVIEVAFSTDGRLLATAGMDRFVKLWDLAKGQVVRTLPQQDSRLSDLAFSPDGKLLATALVSGDVTLWTVADGRRSSSLPGGRSVEFNPNGRLLASAGVDGSVKLWDVASGQKVRAFASQTEATRVAFNADGSRLASAGSDGSTTLWDTTIGRELFTLLGHRDKITSLAFSPDGRLLAMAGFDGTVRLEPMKIEDLKTLARKRLSGRELTPQERQTYLHQN